MSFVEITYPDELIAMLQPGTAVRVDYGKNNINNELRHIRAIVDDDQVVYKVWSPRKQTWQYHVKWLYGFLLMYKNGNLLPR